ncbi:hypothetical protein ACFLRF_00900 [Candidatus Altiarchaeota archaeon]
MMIRVVIVGFLSVLILVNILGLAILFWPHVEDADEYPSTSSTFTTSTSSASTSTSFPTYCGDGACTGSESPVGCDPVPELPNLCDDHVFCPEDCGIGDEDAITHAQMIPDPPSSREASMTTTSTISSIIVSQKDDLGGDVDILSSDTSCTDTDQGIDTHVFGIVTYGGTEYPDECEGEFLREAYCKPELKQFVTNCLWGCTKGECLDEDDPGATTRGF